MVASVPPPRELMMIAPPVPIVWLPLNVEWSMDTGSLWSATIAPPPGSHSADVQVASLAVNDECETESDPKPSARAAMSPRSCDPRSAWFTSGADTKMPPPWPRHSSSQLTVLPSNTDDLITTPPKIAAPPPKPLHATPQSTRFALNVDPVTVKVASNTVAPPPSPPQLLQSPAKFCANVERVTLESPLA